MDKRQLYIAFVLLISFQWSAAEDGDCTMACTHILDPVCATDGRTFRYFANRCSLEGHNKCEATKYREVDESNCDDNDWQ